MCEHLYIYLWKERPGAQHGLDVYIGLFVRVANLNSLKMNSTTEQNVKLFV